MPRKLRFLSGLVPPLFAALALATGFAPVAQAAVTVTANGKTSPPRVLVAPNTSVNLSASATSCPPLGGYTGYYAHWIFGDGTTYPPGYAGYIINQSPCAQPVPISHTYSSLGTYTVTFTYGRYYCYWLGCYITTDGTGTVKIKVVKIQALQIIASLQASTCVPDIVTVSALDAGAKPVATTSTLHLATTSRHGNWTLVSGNGAFTSGAANSGTATYQYAAADNGVVQLALADVHADNLIINGALVIAQPSRTINGHSGTIKFRDNAFVFTQTAPPGDGAGVVVAGRPEAIKVDMIRRDPATGSCGPAPGYNVTAVKAWIQRTASDPGGIAPTVSGVVLGNAAPATNNLPIAFTNGVANFTLATTDVGHYSIDFEDNTSGFAQNTNGSPRPIIGASNALTVRPFALAFATIQAGTTANPGGTTPAAAVFTAAGRAFSVTLNAVRWQSGDPADGVPSGPVNAAGRSTTPHFAWATALSAIAPFTPSQGTLGTLGGGNVVQTAWAGGGATDSQIAYSEVGSVSLKATAANYLSSAYAIVGGLSTPVGRFIPDHFAAALNAPQFATACISSNPGFTYLGQPFLYQTKPVVMLTAENAQNGITKNYNNFTAQGGGDWFRLANSSLSATVYTDAGAHPIDTAGLTVNGANPAITNPSPGVATLSFSAGAGLDYTRPAPPAIPEAPFNASPTLSQQVVDLDGVKSTPDPVTFSAIPFSGGASIRYGRIRLKNAYGSELLALPVSMQAQYYQGSSNGFVTNTDDACSVGITVVLSNYQGNLVSGMTQPALVQPPTAGVFNLSLSAPGAGNTGSVIVTAKVPSWLQYDWKSPALIDPAALAVFGLYEGSPYQIFLQEIY